MSFEIKIRNFDNEYANSNFAPVFDSHILMDNCVNIDTQKGGSSITFEDERHQHRDNSEKDIHVSEIHNPKFMMEENYDHT